MSRSVMINFTAHFGGRQDENAFPINIGMAFINVVRRLLTEINTADLARQYDELERKQGPLDKKTDIEKVYGQGVRDAVSDDSVYGKHHRPGIDFVKDPAHAKHKLHDTATKLGYIYSGSHLVQGKPYHVYTNKLADMGVRNMALTSSKTGKDIWSFSPTSGGGHYEASDPAELERRVKAHTQYLRRKHGLKKVPGITE